MFCDRTCASSAKRVDRPQAERRAMKAAYDAVRRIELADQIREEKRLRHLATYNPEREREKRKLRMPAHVEYCRRPEYRQKKKAYDRQHRCKRHYGPFWEAAAILLDVQEEVHARATDYEIRTQNGTLNKALQRRRDDARPQR